MQFPLRINKYLRDRGLASRREADKLIADGKVFVNGKPAKTGMLVNDGYKPRGLATQALGETESVVMNWKDKGLFPVGRLDKMSEGLLILTNDGRLTTKLTGPDSKSEKEYIVNVAEGIREGIPEIFAKGMETKTFGKLLPAKAKIIARHTIRIVLHEGKHHQIRVMFGELGLTVTGIKRVRIGNVKLGNLRPGQTRELAGININ